MEIPPEGLARKQNACSPGKPISHSLPAGESREDDKSKPGLRLLLEVKQVNNESNSYWSEGVLCVFIVIVNNFGALWEAVAFISSVGEVLQE